MQASFLRIALSPNPNPNLSPKSTLLAPSFSGRLHPLLRHRRHRPLLRPVAAVKIRSPADDARSNLRAPSSTSVLIDVTGMMCGACATRVKSALSSDPRVESAVVNALTETAAVKLRSDEGSLDPDSLAEEIAGKLTALGFPSKRRRLGVGVVENVKKWKEMKERKEELLNRSRNRVAFAWTLVALCCGSHASHLLHFFGIHVAHGEKLHLDQSFCILLLYSWFIFRGRKKDIFNFSNSFI